MRDAYVIVPSEEIDKGRTEGVPVITTKEGERDMMESTLCRASVVGVFQEICIPFTNPTDIFLYCYQKKYKRSNTKIVVEQ